MKKIFILIIAAALWLSACGYTPAPASQSDIYVDTEISEEKEESSAESSEIDKAVIKKTYGFLISPYTVTSSREAFGTVYKCDYFFLNGVVAGIQATTTLPNEKTAETYYDTVLDDDPYATINGTTVIYYAHSEDFYFDGYTPEKLQFALEKAGYEVKINFDLVKFNSFYNKDDKDNQR